MGGILLALTKVYVIIKTVDLVLLPGELWCASFEHKADK